MLFAEAGEIPAHIDQLPGDDMNDALLALQRAAHTHEPRGQDGAAIALEGLRPGDDVGDASFVLERGEDQPLALPGRCRIRTMPATLSIRFAGKAARSLVWT
jgi:hypothetical protein